MPEPISRSRVTAGIALVSAGLLTAVPVTVPPQACAASPAVALTASYLDLPADTVAGIDGVIDQVRLGTLTLGGLVSGLGLSGEGLGDLLNWATNVSTLGDLLDYLGLGDLGLSGYSLIDVVAELVPDADFLRNLDLDLAFDNFRLADVVSAFGINAEIPLAVGQLLVSLGDGTLATEPFGSLLSDVGLLTQAINWLNETAAEQLETIPLVGPLLTELVSTLLGADELESLLNTFTLGDLLGDLDIDETLGALLGTVGGAFVSLGNVTIGGILQDLGFDDSLGALTLNDLISGLGGPLGGVLTDGPLGLDLVWLFNGLDLADLLGFLELDDYSLNPGDLVGNWVNPYLADLLVDFLEGQLPQQIFDLLAW